MTQPRNTIRTYALITVAVTSVALIGFGWWLISILAMPDWCNRAIGASEYVDGRPEYAIRACSELLLEQVKALAWNSHFVIGTLALCLLALVVIVLAGGRLSFKASATGVQGTIDDGAGEAAQFVADEAQSAADAVVEATPAKPKVDNPDG